MEGSLRVPFIKVWPGNIAGITASNEIVHETDMFNTLATLGGFDFITFPVLKRTFVKALDSLFTNYPEYKIPDKWKTEDDWKARGSGFLDS